MSTIQPEKKKRVAKKGIKVVQAVPEVPEVSQPKVVEEKIEEPLIEEPQVDVEEPQVDVEVDAPEGKVSDKSQKKKLVYNELKVDIEDLLNKILSDVVELKTKKNKEQLAVLKIYEKYVKKIRSNFKKLEPKEKKVNTRTQPSGFNKPLSITKEMADFAGWDVEEKKSRTDVTVFLCDYVKNNNLQNPTYRRIILPDKKLAGLLRLEDKLEKPLDYSTMQQYIGHLFV